MRNRMTHPATEYANMPTRICTQSSSHETDGVLAMQISQKEAYEVLIACGISESYHRSYSCTRSRKHCKQIEHCAAHKKVVWFELRITTATSTGLAGVSGLAVPYEMLRIVVFAATREASRRAVASGAGGEALETSHNRGLPCNKRVKPGGTCGLVCSPLELSATVK
eukprot:scaffold7226_cov387-Prasinococcus_capsulatus_cf.AAC.6